MAMLRQILIFLLLLGILQASVDAAPALDAQFVTDFLAIGSFSNLDSVAFGDQLIFSLGSGVDKRLYHFDGQTASEINDPFAGNQPNLRTNAVLNGMLYYPGLGTGGSTLYRTDGLSTQFVADVNPAVDAFQNILEMTAYDNYVFYRAVGPNGQELFRTDGTTTTEFDLRPGSANSSPGNFRFFNSQLLFDATDGNGKRMLYRVHGGEPEPLGEWGLGFIHSVEFGGNYYWTTNETLYKYDGNTVSMIFQPAGFTDVDVYDANSQYFVLSARDAMSWGLYTWDGTTLRKILNADAAPLEKNTSPAEYFWSGGGGVYKIDLTSAVEVRGFPGNSQLTVDPNTVVRAGNNLIFKSGGPFGYELYRVDGTNATLIGDINPSGNAFEFSSFPSVELHGNRYFIASSGSALGFYETDGFSISLLSTVVPNAPLQVFRIGDFPFVFFAGGSTPNSWRVSDGNSTADFASYFPIQSDATNANPGRMFQLQGETYYLAPSGNIYLLSAVPEPCTLAVWLSCIMSQFGWFHFGRVRVRVRYGSAEPIE